MDYELLEHTADAKFRAYGTTREEAFANAIRAMTAIVTDPDRLGRTKRLTVEIRGTDDEKLLYDLLSRIIFLMDTEKVLPAQASVEKTDAGIRATIEGDDIRNHSANIKAVTYHDMRVEKNGTCMVQVVVDI